MLDANLKAQLKGYLERLTQPVELVASLDDRVASQELRTLLDEIAALSERISVRHDGSDARRPSFSISRAGHDMGVRFAAIPMGHEFSSLVLALLQAGGHPPKVEADVIEQIQALDGDFVFETYMSLTCHNCPDVVQALNLMAVLNPRVRHVAIDGGLFPAEVEARQIMAVPSVSSVWPPKRSATTPVRMPLRAAYTAAAAPAGPPPTISMSKAGLAPSRAPAGAAAAVYAARKGIRTGVVAERFGGQTLDTLGIENFVSVQQTQGPQFAAALEAHVRSYGVDVMNHQRVAALEPALEPGGEATVTLDNGAVLKSRAVVLATGARWRHVDVPGEQEYRNKGVAYCPHCDGPLFKGKRVAVIGGGNSGVEAAIDLAGVVEHVTLIEFAAQLKADAVLVDKLKTLPNVVVHTNAQTTEITGDGSKVDGLVYKDRVSGQSHRVALAGVFVQIGLVPNTDWLRGTVDLSKHGEIVVDERGATSLPGVFAAGDATTVPYKQIIIASGEGSKAALSAFDHLIRSPAKPDATAASSRADQRSIEFAEA